MALASRKVPLWLVGPNGSGGLDTKTNPKMLAPGAVLEATNVDEFRPGEFRVRRGFARLPNTQGASGVGPIHLKNGGGLAVARPSLTPSPWQVSMPWTYGSLYLGGSGNYLQGPSFPAPMVTATLKPTASTGNATFGPLNWTSVQDPDIAKSGRAEQVAFVDSAGIVDSRYIDTVTRSEIVTGTVPGGTNLARPVVMCTTTNYFVQVIVTTTGAINMLVKTNNLTSGAGTQYSPVAGIGAGSVSAAQPWVDMIPSATATDVVILAYRAAAGGVFVFGIDVTTGLATLGPTNIATADATMALGWVQDPGFFNGRYRLATAGGTKGIEQFTLNSVLTVTGNSSFKASRTTGVRQVTGFVDSGVARIVYDVTGTNGPPEDCIFAVRDDNLGFEWTVLAGYCLTSKPGKCNGQWVCVCAYTSATGQSHYAIAWPYCVGVNPGPLPILGVFMMGEGGGRRAQSSLSNAITGTISGETGKLYVAVTRRRSIQTPGSTAQQQLQVQTVELTDVIGAVGQARELGGTFFVPGAVMLADDGVRAGFAAFPSAPEVVVAPTGSAGGGMSALGTYSYRFVWKRTDSSGRVIRSAASPPQSVTLIAGQGTAVTKVAAPPWIATEDLAISLEGYRQGPAATGASGYNLAGTWTQATSSPGGTISFIDLATDAAVALGEYAYFNGNVLENFAPPGHTIMEVGNGRVWVVNSEYPSEVWYSKEYKQGVGLGFNPQNTFRVEGDGRGAIVGMANLDGRMVFFKDTSIWVVSGDGPNDLGQGSFSSPQAISLNIGALTRASIVRTPDGVLFQANTGGIWLLGRDLSLSPVGAPVDGYLIPVTATSATPIVAACMVSAAPQVRLCLASGRVLVFNYLTKRWTTYVVPVGPSTIVSCVDTTLFGWCYELADGSIYQESQTALTDESGATITPVISFPHLQLSGLNGYQRFRGLDLAIDVVGNHTLAVDAEYDYSGAVTGTPKTIALTTATPTAQVEYTPPEGRAKCSAVRPVITIQGAAAGSSFRLAGAVAVIGVKKGSNIPPTSRLT